LAITLCLFLLSLAEHLIERFLVLNNCWVYNHLVQLKVPTSTVLNPHFKTTIWHQTVFAWFVALE
jgi:hypothetical protein